MTREVLYRRKLTVEVTARDIKRGKPHNGSECPIAHALKRLGLENPLVRIGMREAWVGGESMPTAVYKLTQEAVEYGHEFDINGAVKPATFTLRLLKVNE